MRDSRCQSPIVPQCRSRHRRIIGLVSVEEDSLDRKRALLQGHTHLDHPASTTSSRTLPRPPANMVRSIVVL